MRERDSQLRDVRGFCLISAGCNDLQRDSSHPQADAFAAANAKEKASARSVGNDRRWVGPSMSELELRPPKETDWPSGAGEIFYANMVKALDFFGCAAKDSVKKRKKGTMMRKRSTICL